MSTFDVEAGNNNDAIMIDMGISQIVELASAGATPSMRQLALALWVVSCFSLVVDLSAMLHQPARGPVFGDHVVAYYSILAAILAVVPVEMMTAYWLSRSGQDHGRCFLAFANGLLSFGVVLVLVLIAVGGSPLRA